MKKLLLFGLVFLFLVSLVTAIDKTSFDNDILVEYTFEQGNTSVIDTSPREMYNMTQLRHNTSVDGGIIDGYRYCTGTQFDIADYSYGEIWGNTANNGTTMCNWVRATSASQTRRVTVIAYDGSDQQYIDIGGIVQDTPTSAFWDGGNNDRARGGSKISNIEWTWVCSVYNQTNNQAYIFINGTDETIVTHNEITSQFGVSDMSLCGRGGALDSEFIGDIDEVIVWNNTFSEAELQWAFSNYLLGLRPHEGVTVDNTAPVVTLIAPTDNSANNTAIQRFTYNVTNSGGITNNCSLFLNESGTWSNVTYNDTLINNNTFNNFTHELSEGIFKWNVECTDNNSNSTFATENFTLKIDQTNPLIIPKTELGNNQTTIFNNSLDTYITFTDENEIYSVQINWTNGTNIEDNSNLGIAEYQANISENHYISGIDSIIARVCDAHTSLSIKDIQSTTKNEEIKYVMSEGWFGLDEEWVRIKAPSALSWEATTTNKLIDRYSFSFRKYSKPDPYEDFIIESSHPIDIVKDSNYEGHVVIKDIGTGYWVDLEGTEVTKVELTRLSDTSVRARVYGLKSQEVTFNSIGELNCVEETFYFENANSVIGYDSYAMVGDQKSFYLNISNTFGNVNATLIYNNTEYSAGNVSNFTKTITVPTSVDGNQTNITFYWNVTSGLTTYKLQEYNQTVDDFYLDDCTSYNVQSLNFTLYDEDTDTIITNGDFDNLFNYTYNSIKKSYATTATSVNSSQVCIYPSNTTLTGNYYIYYEASGYPQRRYYDNSFSINNVSADIPLYLLATANGIYGRFRTVDSFNNPIDDVEGTMQRDIGGTIYTVEQESSDDAGLMTFWLNPDEDYTFTFSKVGYPTQSFDLRVTTTEIYTVTMGSGITDDSNQSYGTGISYSFEPNNEILNNNTAYDFTFSLTSEYWTVTDCTLYLRNKSNIFTSSSTSYDSDSCDITINYNVGTNDYITSEAVYYLNGTSINTSREYAIFYNYKGQFSLKNFLDDIKSFGSAGFDDFGRMVLAFIIIFIIVGGVSLKMGVREPLNLIVLTISLIWLFAFLGWMTINYTGIPTEFLKKYILAILLSLVAGSYIIKEVTQ